MKKIECDFCKKIIDENEASEITIMETNKVREYHDACQECATKLRNRATTNKEGD